MRSARWPQSKRSPHGRPGLRAGRAWRLAVLACLVWVAAAGGPAWCQEMSEEAREALTRANTAVRQQQWLLAEQQFKIAYDKSSNSPEILLALAQFSERRGGRDLIAAVWYRAYLAARPDADDREQITAKIKALEERALTAANGLIERAMSATSSIAASDRANVLINIASAQAQLGNISGAFSTASSARSANPNSYGDDPFGKVAQTLAGQGNLSGAEDALRRVEPSKRSSALLGVVSTLSFAKRPGDAIAYAAPTTGSDRVYAYTYITKALSQIGDKNGARSNLSIAIDAANRLEKSSRMSQLLNLVDAASEVGEFDTARRVYADASRLADPKDKFQPYYFNTAKWHLTSNLAKWGRVAEAEALYPSVFANDKDPSHAWYRTNARDDIQSAHVKRTEDLIKQGKLSEAEAALAREPWPGAYTKPRLLVVRAYLAQKNTAAARRSLEMAAAGLAKTGIAEAGNAFNYVLLRQDASDAYIDVGDLATSRRILDATAATISKITKPDDKKYPLQYTATAFTKLARAYSAAKNFANAKSAAVEVIKLVNQMSSNDDRASALSALSDLDPQVGILHELAAALPSLPGGSSKQNIIKSLVKMYASGNRDAEALAMAGRIDDVSDRNSLLSTLVSNRADAKNWTGALALANDPSVSGRLYPEIAYKMLAADMTKEAAALEPKFSAGSREADSYYSSLASRQTTANDFDSALKSALRIASIPDRIRSLFSLASTIESIAGHAAAKPIVDRAIGQFAELKSPVDRAETCNSISNYLAYGTVFADDLPAAGSRADNSLITTACTAEALDIPDQSNRLSRLQSALSYAKLTTRPFMSKALVPTRRAISRALSETQGDSSYNASSTISSVAAKLAQDGAIESALELAGFPTDGYSHNAAKAAVAWLAEAGAAADAQRILDQYVATIATAKDDSSRDSRSSAAVGIALAAGNLESALKLASEIKSESSRVSALDDVAASAITRKRFEVALNALERAKLAISAGGPSYYLSYLASLAARAGDKNAEWYVSEVAKQGKPSDEINARDTLIGELLKWKQHERALALLPAQEAALAKLPPSDRWSYRANSFAGQLAVLGDTARLDKLLAAAPAPENKVSVLLTVAYNFVNAERADAARVALARALEANNAVASPTSKVSNLQSIASYYVSAGDAQSARTALARALEEADHLPTPANKSSYLRQAAGTYARIGEVDTARALLTRSMEALNINRPDLAGWIDYTIVLAGASKDYDRAAREALAIADPYWRARAVQWLVSSHVSANRLPSALAVLKSAQPSPLLDQDVMKLIRIQLGKRELDTVRLLIGKIAHPALRDEMRRQAVLFQARQDGIEAALADIGTIEDKVARAYTLVDLGWQQSARTENRSQALYFAQLAFFVAAKLAEQVADVPTKVDILAAVAHGQNTLEANRGAAVLAKAETLATEIADERSRLYAVRWAKPLPPAAKAKSVNSEELNEWSGKVRYGLDSDQYKDVEAFMQSLATKNPTERANSLAQAAGNYGSQISEMHRKAADFEKKRQALAR